MSISYGCLDCGDGSGVLGPYVAEVGREETLGFVAVISGILRGQKS